MPTSFTLVSYSNPKWANAAHTAVDADVVFQETGAAAIPFTASKNDTETHGVDLFNTITAAAATTPIAAYVAPTITPAQQATAAAYSTVTLTSSSTPALNATYAIDQETQADLQSEVLAFDTNGQFLAGGTTIDWPDVTSTLHTFTAPQFKAFVTAVGAYVGMLKAIRRTNKLPAGMTTFPTNTISIS